MSIEFLADERGGVTVLREGLSQSHVAPDDPHLLAFEYMQHMAAVLDTLPEGPLRVSHVGGAGMTMARYVHHTRPGSPQIVLEPDVELTEAVRRELPLPRGARIRVRPQLGREGVAALRKDSADVVLVDAFADGRVPADLTTVEFLSDMARVLAPGGLALLNLPDEPPKRFVARVIAAAMACPGARPVALLALVDVMKGRRYGNTVLVIEAVDGAKAADTGFDVAPLRRSLARSPWASTVKSGRELTNLVAGARPSTDADPAVSPTPPAHTWRQV